MTQLTHGSLFAGIGGFDLGFERAGIKTVWQVEIDPFCRKVLEKHWPNVQRFGDIRECGAANLPAVDIITGGFPCQDISNAGKRVGIDGKRSGLWAEMFRIICEIRPQFVVVENVAALLGRGIERVLGDLAAGGFDAEWDCLPACAFGAPHRRDRVFLVGYSERPRLERYARDGNERTGGRSRLDQLPRQVYAVRFPTPKASEHKCGYSSKGGGEFIGQNGEARDVADSTSARCDRGERQEQHIFGQSPLPARPSNGGDVVDSDSQRPAHSSEAYTRGECITGRYSVSRSSWWDVEPDVGRVANGVPSRVDRLKGLGNSLVPQIAEWIGRRIVEVSKE